MRTSVLKKRDSLGVEEIEAKSNTIQNFVLNSKEFQSAKKIGLYYPVRSEVRTQQVLEASLRARKVVTLPRVSEDRIVFCQVFSALERTLVTGKFGIKEPGPAPEVNDIDLLIVPGVVFGRNGFRLGYGKGFYDRYLEGNSRVFSIGLGFDLQLVDSVPNSSHDRKLDAVVTEKGQIYFQA